MRTIGPPPAELAEELGVIDVELGPKVATRSKEHLIQGKATQQVESYFIVRIPANHVDPTRATQTDDILSWKWWPLADLHTTDQVVYPAGLMDLIDSFLANGAPANPIAFTG